MTLTPQWLDELRARTSLSALIGRTVRVQKAGREYKACCPFHNENTPSFTINDEKGFYHCFGCSAHGDAIRWMTDQRGLSFMDAVKELAAEAGMDVPAPDPRAAKQAEQRAGLHDVMAAAQEYFTDQLGSIEGAQARTYLERRGIKPDTIGTFGFGFAPDSRGGLKRALSKFGDDMLIEAGLLISVEGKDPYDRFRGRLMIPIRDARGRVIAFGGRILGDGEPKYLNSPDTPLFDKGRTLYNHDLCSPASRQTGRVIVCEGYMDVIALAQAGFHDAVAPLGTALTEQQIQMLWRMTEKPLLCFDGDNAGQKAAMRAAIRALPLLKPGHSLNFVTMPEGQDPDDVIASSGAAALGMLLDASEPLVQKLWLQEHAAEPLDTPEDRAGLKARLRLHLQNIADPEIRRHYGDDFNARLDTLFARSPRSNAPKAGRAKTSWGKPSYQPPGEETRTYSRHGSDLLMRGILANLLRRPELIAEHREALADIQPRHNEDAALLDSLISASYENEGLDKGGLSTILGEKLYNRASELQHGDGKAFGFNRQHSNENEDSPAEQSGQLKEAIQLMRQRPALLESLALATRAAEADLTDETYAEQQRLRSEKEDYDKRLSEMLQSPDIV